jgi:hypothetical protein
MVTLEPAGSDTEPPVDQRDIERLEHAPGGIGVDPEVEFRGRGDVAKAVDRPTHHPDLIDQLRERGLGGERQSHVRQRADTEQADLSRGSSAATDDLLRPVPLGARGGSRGPGVGAQPLFAVDAGRELPLFDQRLPCALVDGELLSAGKRGGVQCVRDLFVEGHVPRDDRQRLDTQAVGETGQQDRLCVVAGRVGIDDDPLWHGTTSPLATESVWVCRQQIQG